VGERERERKREREREWVEKAEIDAKKPSFSFLSLSSFCETAFFLLFSGEKEIETIVRVRERRERQRGDRESGGRGLPRGRHVSFAKL